MSRRAWGRVGLVLGSLVAALLVGEGVLRAQLALEDAPGSDDDWYERYRRMNTTIYQRSDDPELVYEPVAGASVEMEYGPAAFTEAGMRDDRAHAIEPDGRTRVALLGDSLVWGEFLALHQTLGPRLRERLGDDFEVLPLGVTGYDAAQEARWYEVRARPYSPEVVVVVWCMNDLLIMSGPFERFADEEDRARKDAQEALFERVASVRRETIDGVVSRAEDELPSRLLARAWGLWRRWRFEAEYTDELLVAFGHAPYRRRAADAIARLGAAVAQDGARGVLVISPVLDDWGDYRWGALHDFVRERGEAAGFEVIDPLEQWRGAHDPESMRVSGDILHYDGSGTEALADVIAAAIGEGA